MSGSTTNPAYDPWCSFRRWSLVLLRGIFRGLVLTGTAWGTAISAQAALSARRAAEYEAALSEQPSDAAREEVAYLEALWQR